MNRLITAAIMGLAITASVFTLFLVDFENLSLDAYDCSSAYDGYVTTTQNRQQAQPLEEFEIFFELLDHNCFSKYSTWKDYSTNQYLIAEPEWEELSQVNKYYSGELECPFSNEYCQTKLNELKDLRWNLDQYKLTEENERN